MEAPTPRKNPNAYVTLAAGGIGGQLVLTATNLLGWTIDAGTANWVAAGLGAAALYIGRNGVKGAIHKLWDGPAQPAQPDAS